MMRLCAVLPNFPKSCLLVISRVSYDHLQPSPPGPLTTAPNFRRVMQQKWHEPMGKGMTISAAMIPRNQTGLQVAEVFHWKVVATTADSHPN